MIVKIKFNDDLTMLFGDSYKKWYVQLEEFIWYVLKDRKSKPLEITYSNSDWKSFGGLKWCSGDKFQEQLNREGCQNDDEDNPNPRQYSEMQFNEATPFIKNKIMRLFK
jgi:hypothetical protein